MHDFVQGLTAWFNGWRRIFAERSLFALSITPFFISLVAAVASFWLIFVYYPPLMESLLPSGPSYLIKPLMWLGAILAIVISLYFVYVMHAVLAQPFYSLMAEKALRLRGEQANSDSGFWAMLKVSLIKGVLFLVIGLMLLVCSWIPGLNLVTIIGTLMLLAFDCFDYSLEARRWGLRKRIRYVFRHPAQWLGMAAGLALTLVIPGLTLLVIPGAVVGGALILKDKQ